MTPALSVQNLCKSFGEFALQDITFDVPCGVVTAIIGENGSGKSTTLACILGQDIPDSGTVAIFGTDPFQDIQAHAALGVSGDISQFPGAFTPNQLESVLKGLFPDWDTAAWNRLLELCQIPRTRRIEQFSRGMKAKLSLAA
ncbi:ATP-binding cassette domain-containing protein, partial [Faecalibaculum rodentium]